MTGRKMLYGRQVTSVS